MTRLTARDPLDLAGDAPLLRAYFEALDRRAEGEHPFLHRDTTARPRPVTRSSVKRRRLTEAKATGLRVSYATDPSLATLEVLAEGR